MGKTQFIGVKVVIEEHDSKLTGRTFIEDVDTKEFESDATLTGTRTGADARWTTESEVVVKGRFEGDRFVGTLEFPKEEDGIPRVTPITLTRARE